MRSVKGKLGTTRDGLQTSLRTSSRISSQSYPTSLGTIVISIFGIIEFLLYLKHSGTAYILKRFDRIRSELKTFQP